AQAFVPASIEISVDYPGLVDDLRQQFGMAKDDLEATAFATGTGTNQPIGIVTAIDGTGNDIGTATTDTYAVADVYTTHETLGPRYRGRGTWAMNAAIINDTRAFGTAVAHTFSGTLTDAPPDRVLGRPLVEASAMDGTINAGAENNIVVFGDFSNYVIADRVGGSLEFIPHLFATANNLPSGQRGWYFWWRVGADSVNDDAFVLLNAT
ncbi:MAG: phage major capsid protein, partial [Acidimicrobiia bacterium]